ncbi:glycosyltransferase family 4 protein [Pectobacterium versatile]|uniref:glycosyltransferase family 4 protein n=1 Tax=Pectobacterium versatile TaxID=2488639 RepID=UPI00102E8E42|nr:glycosyltransferase family 4 protein [Pectobacterium versatile]TAI84938.1 glycosyltransferase [Pectobacterium versatile]
MTTIFFVHLFNDYSGSPRVLRDAINAIQEEKEYDIHIISSATLGFLSEAGCYHVVPYYPHSNKYIQLFRYIISQVITFFLLSYFLIRERFKGNHTIVVVNTLLPFGGTIAAKLLAHCTIAYIHETYIRPRILLRFLSEIANQCAEKALFVSFYVQQAINLKKPKNHVLYNGLRDDFKVPELHPIKKFSEKQVLFVGSLKVYKGIYTFTALAKRLPEVNFVALLNTSVDDFNHFQSELDNIPNFSAYRNPDNLDEFFTSAFMVVNLSDPHQCIETFGLTLLEGMSFGAPVIAPPHGGPIELVNDKVGRLIEPSELDEITTFISELSIDFERWNTFSQNCLHHAAAFSSENYKENILDIIRYYKK